MRIIYRAQAAEAVLALGESWRVRPSGDLLQRLRDWLGTTAVSLEYARPSPSPGKRTSRSVFAED